MTRRIRAVAFTLVFAVAVAAAWQGCGGSDHGSSATFSGNVSSVSPTQTAGVASPRGLLAAARLSLSSTAHAQSTCPSSHLIVCATSGGNQAIVCAPVDPNTCQFDLSLDVLDQFANGHLGFFNDANGNLKPDSGEAFGLLTNDIRPVCNGTVVTLSDVAIDFTTFSATAASFNKNPDACPAKSTPTGTPPTPTPTAPNVPPGNSTSTPTPSSTPTRTATAGGTPTSTPTPTGYGYGLALNDPPSRMLAVLFGVGAFGLIVPRRRSRARRE
jgi:hypothetical protein